MKNTYSVSDAVLKMIGLCGGSQYDINHFLKVLCYARTIGKQEGLDERTLETLEFAAVVHDIACPSLRKEYGSAPGDLQEKYGFPLVQEFFKDSGLDEDMIDRICYLVGHHHTFSNVDGPDYQILLEADFLVNAGEKEQHLKNAGQFRKNVFKTKTGIALLEDIYLRNNDHGSGKEQK